jgi:hypothetical protein
MNSFFSIIISIVYVILYHLMIYVLNMQGCHFTTCGKHIHDGIILPRGEVWAHKTSLTSKRVMACIRPSERSLILH